MGKLKSSFFICDCGTHYSNGHLVIRKKLPDFEVKELIFYVMLLLIHRNNVVILLFYTCRSAQLNVNRRMREQEYIKSLISNMRMRFLRN